MKNQKFVIVGGSHGIGLGIVKRLADRGAHVTVVSRSSELLVGIDNVKHVPWDVTTDAIPASVLPEQIHGLAYCPGSINLGPLRSVTAASLMADFQLNVMSAIASIQAALPAMKSAETASIVLFSTVAVAQGLPMHTSVAASKGAIEAISRTLAAELAPKIRVNCIAPALTDTPLAEKFLATDEKRAAMAERYPLKRIGRVDDIASIAEFLLSRDSGWMTGQVIAVDGGMSTLRT